MEDGPLHDVGEGEVGEVGVLLGDADSDAVEACADAEEVEVGEHDAFGVAGGAGGVTDGVD